MIVYSAALAAALAVSAPWWLWRMATSGRYRAGLGQRLGRVSAELRLAVAGRRVIWVHAVSVGEVLAAERLVAELGAALGKAWVVVVSTTTAAGQKIAEERFGAERVFTFPLDFASIVRLYLQALNPELLVLMESELWPRLLVECERTKVPVAVVNARISDRSFPRYMRLRWLWMPLLAKVAFFLAQGEESAERLRRIGAERVRVVGNLKYDLRPVGINSITERLDRERRTSPIIVAGSTLAGEEEMLLSAWPKILRDGPEFIMVIAPRHPERFGEVWDLLQESGFNVIRCSDWMGSDRRLQGGSILLLDTVGDLASVYSVATTTFIGGSLVPKGGHNPLEAARFGKPIVMGESYENFREIVEGMDSIHIIKKEQLGEALISSSRHGQHLGDKGRHFYQSQAGATRRTVEALLELVR